MLLTHDKTRAMVAEMRAAATSDSRAFLAWLDNHNVPALLYLPMGELTNKGIAGYVWAWKAKGRLGSLLASEADKIKGLRMQGLEGLLRIETDLCSALLAYDELPEFRARVATNA